MSLDLTRQSLFTTLFYFALLIAVFWGEAFIGFGSADTSLIGGESILVSPDAGVPLGRWIDRMLAGAPLPGTVLSALLVILNSFLVTRLVIRNVIFLERTYMPSIIYLLISSGYYNSYLSFRPLLVTLLLLLAAEIIFRSYHQKALASGTYLTVGFLVGSTAVVYAPALCLVLLLPAALSMFRLFDLREWIAALGGWMLPIFFSAYGVWLAGGEFLGFIGQYRQALLTPGYLPSAAALGSFEWTFIGCVALLFVLSVITFLRRGRTYKLQPYRAYLFFVWMLMVLVAMQVVLPCRSVYELPMLALPLAVIIPTYFNSRKPGFVPGLIYLLMIACAVVIHLLPVLLN